MILYQASGRTHTWHRQLLRERERERESTTEGGTKLVLSTFSIVPSTDMETVEKVVVAMLGDINTASTELYRLLHLHSISHMTIT